MTAASICAAAQPGGQHVARDSRQIERGRRVVALVRDRDELGTEAEREQHLGRGWDEADDSHLNWFARGSTVGGCTDDLIGDDMAEILGDDEIAQGYAPCMGA